MTKNIFLPAFLGKRGNTLAEYALIGFLLIGISITGWMALGGSLNNNFGIVRADMANHINLAGETEAQAVINANPSGTNGTGTSSGTTLYPPPGMGVDSGASTGAITQTTGAMGSQMTSTIASGNPTNAGGSVALTQEDKNKVTELANLAHKVALIQAMLENLLQYSGDDVILMKNTTISYEGRAFNVYELAYEIKNGADIQALLSKKQEVINSNATGDVKNKVEQLTSDITNKASTSSDATIDALNNNTKPPVSSTNISQDTNTKAEKICDTGGGSDNGVKCTVP